MDYFYYLPFKVQQWIKNLLLFECPLRILLITLYSGNGQLSHNIIPCHLIIQLYTCCSCLSKIRLGIKLLLALGMPVANTNYECTDQSIVNLSLVPAVSSILTASVHSQLFVATIHLLERSRKPFTVFFNNHKTQKPIVYCYYCSSNGCKETFLGPPELCDGIPKWKQSVHQCNA